MAPPAHPHHTYLDQEMAVLIHPLAREAGMVSTGPFNLGDPYDYRVPDRGIHARLPDTVWVSTAALVVEIVSPDDETYAKLPFYLAHAVSEVWVVEPDSHHVRIFILGDDAYSELDRSVLLEVDAQTLDTSIDWP